MPACNIDFDSNGTATRYCDTNGIESVFEYDSDGTITRFKYGDLIDYSVEQITNLKYKLINNISNSYILVTSDMQGHILNAETSLGYKCEFVYDEEFNLIGFRDDSLFSQQISIDNTHAEFKYDGPEDMLNDDKFLMERYEFSKTFSVIKYINSMGRSGIIQDKTSK